MNLLLSFEEIFNDHKAAVIGIAIALVLIIVAVILIVILGKKKKQKENPEVELIKKTLRESGQIEDDKKHKNVVKQNETEIIKEEPKQEVKVEEVKVEEKKEEAPKAEPKKEVKPVSAKQPKDKPTAKAKAVKAEPKKEEAKPEEVKEEAKPAPKAKAQPKEEKKAPAKKAEPKKEEASKAEPEKRVLLGKYEVYFDGEKYFYVLKASNGEKLIISETYTTKDGVLKAIEAVKRNSVEGRVLVTSDKRGLYQFTLMATNHRKLVMSANYPTEKRAIAASESFKRFAPISPVVEIEEQVESLKEEITPNYVNKKGGKIGVIKEDDGRFCYILKASNGEILINSDHYKTADLANNGLNTFKDAMENGKFFVEKDKRGYFQFKLYSQSGRLIVAGESYPSKANAISACNSLCSFMKEAQPLD